MFTGLVEEMGKLIARTEGQRSARLTVRAQSVHEGASLGDSIAVNGCCLTVVEIDSDLLTFDAVPETLARTNLGGLAIGQSVNLERPLGAAGRLGGHFVQGHVDGVGTVLSVRSDENAVVMEIGLPRELWRYVVMKGSISVDGVSLTVAGTASDNSSGCSFTVWLVPHTCAITTLGDLGPGDRVNIECDLLGKYIEKLLAERTDGVTAGAAEGSP